MADFEMTQEQYNKLIDSIQAARMEVAEVKGAVATFGSNMAQESAARAALGQKYDAHDVILRGDGVKQSGLADQIQDLKDKLDTAQKDYIERAKTNADNIAALRKSIWVAAGIVAAPIIGDLALRLIQIAYHGSVIP